MNGFPENMNHALSSATDDVFCALHECIRERDLVHAKHVQQRVCAMGLDTQTVLKCHFIPMFVDCGSTHTAQHAFNKLITRDEWSWRYLIQGYADDGDIDHAFELFQRMQEDGVHPSKCTIITLLKACARMKSLSGGRELHLHIVKKGYEDDCFVTTTLVDMYMAFASTTDACAVFDASAVRDVFLWTTLLDGYGDQGLHAEALECLQRMQSEGVSPDRVTYVCSLKSCTGMGTLEKGLMIHNSLIKEGFEKDTSVFHALVTMYGKFGWLSEAKSLLLGFTSRCISLWNALISGYSEYGLGEEALECFEEMRLDGVSPDGVTFVYSLKACSGVGSMHICREIHIQITKLGIENLNFIGSILVDAYIKCGWLEEAHEVFSTMATHDVVSWTTLIAGYVEHRLYENAMLCFEEMQREGVSPDVFTFVCILNSCLDSVSDVERGLYTHAETVKRGMEILSAISSSLIKMYAHLCMFTEARSLFDELPAKDKASWDGLIGGLVNHGFGEAAMALICEMQRSGASMCVTTYLNGLKACRALKSAEKGLELHSQITMYGLDTDLLLRNNLVDMYSMCGCLLEAEKVFDGMDVHSSVSWSALVLGYAEHGHYEQVLNCFEQMQMSGVTKDVVAFICSLNVCGCIGDLSRGQAVHINIVIEGLERDLVAGSSLVDMYAKCGSLHEAEEVLQELPVRNVVSWTTILTAHAEQAHTKDAFRCFEQMQSEGISPNAVTYVALLGACCKGATLLGKGRQIHSEIVEAGFDLESSVCSALVGLYASYGSLTEAQKIFDNLVTRDLLSWNVLLGGYSKQGQIKEVLECLGEMQNDGICPDDITYLHSLGACYAIEALDIGQSIHSDVVKRGLELIPSVSSSLVNMYAKHQALPDAQIVFYQLQLKDTISWTSILVGYFEQGLSQEALKFFEEMQEEGVSADVVTWNAVLDGCTKQGEAERAFLFWSQMLEQCVLPDLATYLSIIRACHSASALKFGKRVFAQCCKHGTFEEAEKNMATSLVEMFGSCGSMTMAQQVFDAMPQKDITAWNALMRGYSRQGDVRHALMLLKRMEREGARPDSLTFLCILMMCNHAGLLDKAQVYYETMSTEYGISASIDHHNCITDLVGRAGHLNDTLTLLKQMPFQSNVAVANTLLSACQKWGNVEVGEQVFEQAVRLKENHPGLFILMSNLYASDMDSPNDYGKAKPSLQGAVAPPPVEQVEAHTTMQVISPEVIVM